MLSSTFGSQCWLNMVELYNWMTVFFLLVIAKYLINMVALHIRLYGQVLNDNP